MKGWLMGLWRLRSPRSAVYRLEPQESWWCRSSPNPEGLRTMGASGVSPSPSLKSSESGADVQGQEKMDVLTYAENKSALPPAVCSVQVLNGLDSAHLHG